MDGKYKLSFVFCSVVGVDYCVVWASLSGKRFCL